MTSRSPPSLKYVIHLHFDVRSSIRSISDRFLVRDFVPLFRSFLDWFQSIQTRRCHCLRLKDVLMFQASSYKLCSAGKRTFRWMLLNNILSMAPGMYDVSRWQLYIITFLIEYMYSVKIAILIFHTWGEGSILLFIIPLLCHSTI